MSNISHRNTEARQPIWFMVTSTLFVVAVTCWVAFGGEVFDGRHLVGTLLGITATMVLLISTMGRIIYRSETGSWLSPEGDHCLLVRMEDWPAGHAGELAEMLDSLEQDGWVPADTLATRRIRSALAMDPVTEEN